MNSPAAAKTLNDYDEKLNISKIPPEREEFL
jgi:hypothetical protein